MPLPPDKLPPPPETSLLPGREPRIVDTGSGSSVTFSGLVLHYTCDDLVTTDTSGNGNTGTLFGSGNVLSTGLINNKITLSSSGGIQFTTVAGLGLATSTTAMSISCWIKTTTLDCTIVSLRNTGNANTIIDLVLGYNGVSNLNTGTFSFLIRDDGGAGLNSVSGATALNDGNWHHVAWTRTTGQVNTLYVDNVSVGTVTDVLTGALTPNVAGSAIGFEIVAGGRPLNGSIDDYQQYNRALTPAEVTAIYNGAAPSSGYTLSANTTAFGTNGFAAGTLCGRMLQETTIGTFTTTGINANLVYASFTNYVLVCGTGQFNFIGYPVGSPGAGLGISGGLGMPVVTVLSGGIPVVDVSSLGPNMGAPVSEAAPGRGIPVTKVSKFGTPVVYI